MTEMAEFALDKVENFLGEGENLVSPENLLFQKCFQNIFSGCYKLGLFGKVLNPFPHNDTF